MSPLVRELLINGLMAGTAVRTAKKKSVSIAYYGLAGAVAGVGFVFLSIAAYTELQNSFSAPLAAAMVGGGIIFISLLIGLWGYLAAEDRKIMRKKPYDGNFIDTVEDTLKSLMDGIEEPVKDNPKMALLMAALAGFAAGDKLGEKIH